MTALLWLFVGCSRQPEVLSETPENFPTHFSDVLQGEWPPSGYSKVVGYRFDYPETVEQPWILWPEGRPEKFRINEHKLSKLTAVQRELSPSEAGRLLKCTFSEKGETSHSACYEPHHIFVFYSTEGKITHAIEVCFSCHTASIAPTPSEGDHRAVDFAEAAKLCEELGLWFTDWEVSKYVADLKKGD